MSVMVFLVYKSEIVSVKPFSDMKILVNDILTCILRRSLSIPLIKNHGII